MPKSVLKPYLEEIKQLLTDKNNTYYQIAKKYNVSLYTISSWARKLGFRRRTIISEQKRKRIIEQYKTTDIPLKEIADKYGVSITAIYPLLARSKLKCFRKKTISISHRQKILEAIDYIYVKGVVPLADLHEKYGIYSANQLQDYLNFKTFTPSISNKGSKMYRAHEIYNGIAGRNMYVYCCEKKLLDLLAETIPIPKTQGHIHALTFHLSGQRISFAGIRYLYNKLNITRKSDARYLKPVFLYNSKTYSSS